MVQTFMSWFHAPSLGHHHNDRQHEEPVVEEDHNDIMETNPCKASGGPVKCEFSCENHCALHGRVCPFEARMAALYACSEVKKLSKGSNLFSKNEKTDFIALEPKDVKIYERLGAGGYSNVNRCLVKAGPEANHEFAIKYLKRQAMMEKCKFMHGAADLAMEAYFLHKLDHPNIVKLHGITAGSVENNVATGKECGFFIIVDRLYDTLDNKIATWSNSITDHHILGARRVALHEAKQRKQIRERCEIALSISNAMAYLHSLGIVYRDLKPDNVGFDKEGNLKLFDFGLAKELKQGLKAPRGGYQLTGKTGSRRYMAPEVALQAPYDQSVDVYSFGILLWEMCTTKIPFYGYGGGRHMHRVFLGGERPPMDEELTRYWPLSLQWLIKKCWATDPTKRPDFETIRLVLREILETQNDSSTDGTTEQREDHQEKTTAEEHGEEEKEHHQRHIGLSLVRPHTRGRRHSTATTTDKDHHSTVAATTLAKTRNRVTATSTPGAGASEELTTVSPPPPVRQRGRSKSWGLVHRR